MVAESGGEAVTTLSDLRAEARRIESVVDDIIGELDPSEIEDAVNWGCLCCVEVALVLNQGDDIEWVATIEEASSDAHSFAMEIINRLNKRDIHNVTIRTEW